MEKQQKSTTPPEPVHQPGTRAGEEIKKKEGREPGHKPAGVNKAGRPLKKRDLEEDKSVGSQAPIDPGSPHIPAP